MSRKLLSLAPFHGLDTRMVQHGGQGTPMVGGYNVEVRDGEWWVRPGHEMNHRQPIGTQPFPRFLNSAGLQSTGILVGPWGALVYGASQGSLQPVYGYDATSSTTFTNGSAAATSAGAVAVLGDMILATANVGAGYDCYRVAAVSGTSITLDRAYVGTGGAIANTRYYRPLHGVVDCSTDYGISANSPAMALTDAVMMEQLVTYSATTLGYSNPATVAGHRYIIVTSGDNTTGEPVAFDYDLQTTLPLHDWFRLTGLAAPTEIASGLKPARYCEVFKSCLWIAGGDDPTGNADKITLWYSRPNNFMLWHDGIQSGTYNHRFIVLEGSDEENPIVGLKALGEQLIVYRRISIDVVFPSGGSFDYTSLPQQVRSFAGSIVNVAMGGRGVHLLMTNRGPAVCDGSGIAPVKEVELREAMREFGWNSSFADTGGVLHESSRSRVSWFTGAVDAASTRHQSAAIPASGTQVYTGNTYSVAGVAMVFDYAANEVWLEDDISWVGGGEIDAGSFAVRPDGSVAKLYPHTDGKDGAVLYTSTDVAVDALAETPWLSFQGGAWGVAHNAVVLLRALDGATTSDNDVTDLWASSADTIHFGTVDFFTDWSMTAKCSRVMTMTVSEMQALAAEGTRALPLIPFHFALEEVAGKVVKLRFRNTGGAGNTVKGHFRVAEVELWGEDRGEYRPRVSQTATA